MSCKIATLCDSTGKEVFVYAFADFTVKYFLADDISQEWTGDPLTLTGCLPDINHFLFYGQSLATGSQGQPAISTAPVTNNLMFAGGVRPDTGEYATFIPVAESDDNAAPDGGSGKGETGLVAASELVEDADPDHTMLLSTAGRGSYEIALLTPGSVWYDAHVTPQITEGFNTSQSLGRGYDLQAVAWLQGEADITGPETSATYQAKLESIIDDINATALPLTGQPDNAVMFIGQLNFRVKLNAKIHQGQYNAHNTAGNDIVIATPTYQFPYAADAVHMTNVGYHWMGKYFGRAYEQTILNGTLWQPTAPTTLNKVGDTITIDYNVPEGALQINTTDILPFTDFGFRIRRVSNNANIPISSVTVSGSQVIIVLSVDPAEGVRVRYGLDHTNASITCDQGAGGNISDTSADTVTILGTTYHMHNFSVIYSRTVV